MILPSRIRVGRKKYVIEQVPALSRSRRGHWTSAGRIVLGVRSELGRRYTAKSKGEAFWHELTHAILHDMRSPLWSNETFVAAFSKRLNNAVHSAEFE